jgi:hypothetical protein
MWTRKSMAIEDPFDLSHNLAAGLTRNSESGFAIASFLAVFHFIMRSFQRSRRVFGEGEVRAEFLKQFPDASSPIANPRLTSDYGVRYSLSSY